MTTLHNLDEAAKLLGGINPSTLRRWIAQGKVPVVRFGRRVMVSQEAIDDLVRRHTRRAPTVASHGEEGTSRGEA